jgi:hypothetical protein
MFLLPRYADRDASRAPAILEPFAEVPAANIPQ